MPYKIKKYYLKKQKGFHGKEFVIKAKVIKTNIFGCITDFWNEELTSEYICLHEACGPISIQVAIPSKKEAKIILRELNRKLQK